jgi:hypothetical protein
MGDGRTEWLINGRSESSNAQLRADARIAAIPGILMANLDPGLGATIGDNAFLAGGGDGGDSRQELSRMANAAAEGNFS